ncbi:MAG: hypothetical protein O2816_13010, partial [Planctomycetota bacterium]|nr:hypothetical protein [Planctomycetota bacterium]
MSRVPLVALAVALAVALGACVAPREPVEVHFDEDLEPHVRVACEAALARLPEPLARRVAGVRFRRQDLDVPAGAPA